VHGLHRIRAEVSQGKRQINTAQRELRQLETTIQASSRKPHLSEVILAQSKNAIDQAERKCSDFPR
jgi:hypothetical protein